MWVLCRSCDALRFARDQQLRGRTATARSGAAAAVRDRMDREYAQPLDVEALARGVHMSAGHLSRQFRLAYGESPYSYLMTRRIERAMAHAAARRPQRHRRLLRGRLLVPGHVQHPLHRAGRCAAQRLPERRGVSTTAGMPPCVAKQVTRPIRNREAPAPSTATSVTAMNLTIHTAVLPHDDPDASVAFYRDVLGFEVRTDYGDPARCAGSPSARPTSPTRRSSWHRRPPTPASPTTSSARSRR